MYLQCVCGARLARMDARSRCRQLFITQTRDRISEAELEQLVTLYLQANQTGIVCDLCDCQLAPTQSVFYCGNGDRTILHPTAYDVCEGCFMRFCVQGVNDDSLAKERRT